MATWCTNCRQQLRTVRDVYTQLDAERYAFIGLSVETDLPREQLASYAEVQGWPWRFAVMTPELLQELSSTFGLTVANPPATPHFLIGPDGSTSALSTGFHSAETPAPGPFRHRPARSLERWGRCWRRSSWGTAPS